MGHRPRPFVLLLLALVLGAAILRPGEGAPAPVQAQAAAPEVWFAPYPTGIGPPSHLGFGAPDYMDLFEEDSHWSAARDRVDVFQLYWEWVIDAEPADVEQAVAYLAAHGIAIAVEVPALEFQDVGLPTQCGPGAEGWVEDDVAITVEVLDIITGFGGTVRSLTMQEPYSAASPTASAPFPASCAWNVTQVANHVAAYIAEVRLAYPATVWGSVESDHISPSEFAGFADAFLAALGEPLQYMHYDVDWAFRSNWAPRALETENLMRARGIPFGMIYNGVSSDSSDAQWVNHAIEHFTQYEDETGGHPDQVKFQSWHKHPQHLLPESDASAMTALLNRYFDARTDVALSVGAASVSSRVATVTATSNGLPVGGTPVEVRYRIADGPGVEGTYSIAGVIPPGATRAVVGYRVNQECNCNFAESHFTFYEGTFRTDPVQANVAAQANRIQNFNFAAGLAPWVELGAGQFLAGNGIEPNRVRVDASALDAAMLNSAASIDPPLIAGRFFEATFRAKIDPRSIGSGYFTVVFVNDAGGPWVEVARFREPIEPKLVTVSGVTNNAGIATLALPSLPAARLQVQASVGGAAARVPGYSALLQVGALAPDASLALPAQIAAGAPATAFRLLGARFNWDSSVTWDGNARMVTFVSASELRFTALAGDLSTSGPHTITVTTPGPGGGTDTITYTVAPRTLQISGSATATEGSPYTLGLSASYPGSNTITSWRVTWGDGAVQDVAGNPASVQHTYADGPAPHVVSATATDADGTWPALAPLNVSVLNAAPLVTLGGPASVAEGSEYHLTFSAADPGADTVTGWSVDWGDGSAAEALPAGAGGASHVFANGPSSPVIAVTVTDEDGSHGPKTKNLAVSNVAPALSVSGPGSTVRDEVYTLTLGVSDPGSETPLEWRIDWGDGSAIESVAAGATGATHAYTSAPVSLEIEATYRDGDGDWAAAPVDVDVFNSAPPLSVSGAGSVAEGAVYTLNLSSGADFTIVSWTIDWGDGAVEAWPGDPESASHTYADGPATFVINASATDGVSTWQAAPHPVDVADVAPTLTVAAPETVDEGALLAITFSASDPGADPLTGWTVDWGDGSPVTDLAAGAAGASHAYADGPANHEVVVTALNGDGSFAADAVAVAVVDVLPIAAAAGAAAVDEGSVYAVSLSVTDPGADATAWRVDWGDGLVEDLPAGSVLATHTYPDGPASHGVSVVALQADDEYASGSWTVDVEDVAPQITLLLPASVREQNPVEAAFSLSDPGDDTLQGWTLDWGDGAPEGTLDPEVTAAEHSYALGGGVRTVTVTAANEDGLFSASAQVSVLPGPVLTVSGAATAEVGASYTLSLSADPPIITGWTIDWGDGVVETVSGGAESSGHTYSAPGNRTISVTGTDSYGTWTANAVQVDVEAVDPGHLKFEQQPSPAAIRSLAFPVQPVVAVRRSTGEIDTGFEGPVTLSLVGWPGEPGATLNGPVTVQAVAGIATFSGLSISFAGDGFALAANADGLSEVESAPITVALGPTGTHQLATLASGDDIAVFGRNEVGGIWSRETDAGTWGPWQYITGGAASAPAAVSSAGGQFIFYRGTGDDLRYVWRGEGELWSPPVVLGGTFAGAPAAAVDPEGDIVVVVRTGPGTLWMQRFDGSAWSGWLPVEGNLSTTPVLAGYPDGIYMAGPGQEGETWVRRWDGGANAWDAWEFLGGRLEPGLAAAYSNGQVVLLGLNAAGDAWRRSFAGGTWSGWTPATGTLGGRPWLASAGDGLILAGVDIYGGAWALPLDGGGWGGWVRLGGTLLSDTVAVAHGESFTVLGIGLDHAIWFQTWDGASWSGWQTLGGGLAVE